MRNCCRLPERRHKVPGRLCRGDAPDSGHMDVIEERGDTFDLEQQVPCILVKDIREAMSVLAIVALFARSIYEYAACAVKKLDRILDDELEDFNPETEDNEQTV